MEKLKITERIAEIEKIKIRLDNSFIGMVFIRTDSQEIYDPSEWSNLGPLMIKHGVSIHMQAGRVKKSSISGRISIINFSNKEEIPRAILECIIKSQGK